VLGSQWGDEGKGKLVDILAQRYDVVARAQARPARPLPASPAHGCPALAAQGGANAGHTIYDAAGKKYALHLVPSGILNPGAACVVGNGCVVHLPSLFEELAALKAAGIKARIRGRRWSGRETGVV
jgi:adenylosuccinate synthase